MTCIKGEKGPWSKPFYVVGWIDEHGETHRMRTWFSAQARAEYQRHRGQTRVMMRAFPDGMFKVIASQKDYG